MGYSNRATITTGITIQGTVQAMHKDTTITITMVTTMDAIITPSLTQMIQLRY